MLLVRLLFIFTILGSQAFGDEVTNLSTGQNPKLEKNYNISFSTVINTSLHRPDDESQRLSNEFSISPTVDLGDGYTAFGSLSGLKDLKGQREFFLNDSVLGISKKLRQYGDLSLSGKIAATVPLSDSSKKDKQLRTAIKFSPSLAWKVIKGLKVSYSPAVKINFHKFKNSISGSSNMQYSLSNSASLSYSLRDNVILGAGGSYARSISYRGNSKDSYFLSQTVTFLPTTNTDITFGHAIGGSPLEANGIDTEIEVFNNRKSSVFAGFGYTY